MMVTLARYLLIAVGITLIPAWKLWILGGWTADKRAQMVRQRKEKPSVI